MQTWKQSFITLSLLLFLNTPVLAASPSRGNNGTPPGQEVVTPTPAQADPSPTPEQTIPSPTPTTTQPEPSPVVTSPTPTPVPERHSHPTPTPTIAPNINFDGEVIPSPTPTTTPTPTPAVLGTSDPIQPPKVVQQLANKTIDLIRPPLSHLFPQLSDSAYAEQRIFSPAQSLSLFVLALCFFYLGARLLRPRIVKKWERRLLKRKHPVPEQPWLPHYQT